MGSSETTITARLDSVRACGNATGVVARLAMPLPLRAMKAMDAFIRLAYGPGCTVREDPKGWMEIRTPDEAAWARNEEF